MFRRVTLAIACSAALTATASAAGLPAIKAGPDNTAPACATPGRLMAFLRERNPRLADKFATIAVEYMRHGEQLAVRWDYAFFQMIVETGSLSFTGDVQPGQNNFAGLGATGGGVRGEGFDSVSTGVKAHLQHLLMYAGEDMSDAVAERTRKVQEWRVLDGWRRAIRGQVTFKHMAQKWAPSDRGYARDIEAIGQIFLSGACTRPDPEPGLVAAARGQLVAGLAPGAPVSGRDLAEKAVERARDVGPTVAYGLGATGQSTALAAAAEPASLANVTVLNPTTMGATSAPATPPVSAATEAAPSDVAVARFASNFIVPPAASPQTDDQSADRTDDPAAQPSRCRVWTASYGGQRSLIIRSVTPEFVNFTVLDVNDGREDRESDAYIAAYAKGGKAIETFKSNAQALSRAFDLCPEGNKG